DRGEDETAWNGKGILGRPTERLTGDIDRTGGFLTRTDGHVRTARHRQGSRVSLRSGRAAHFRSPTVRGTVSVEAAPVGPTDADRLEREIRQHGGRRRLARNDRAGVARCGRAGDLPEVVASPAVRLAAAIESARGQAADGDLREVARAGEERRREHGRCAPFAVAD